MLPTDAGVLRRLRSAWGDSEVTSEAIRQRFSIHHDDLRDLAKLWGPRVPPSPMPEWGGIRNRTAQLSGTWRRKDDERRARKQAQQKAVR